MRDTIFSGVREKWLPLYKEFRDMMAERLGPFEEQMTTSAVLWKHRSTFADISFKKAGMVVAVAAETLHNEWNPTKVLQTSKNRVIHYFEITDNSAFADLAERVATAYQMPQSNRPRKVPVEKVSYTTIDEYITMFPEDVKETLELVRKTIREAAPDAQERISWQMPTFYLNENLVHFAAHKSHIGFYPGESGIAEFSDRFGEYKSSKGAIQFPLSKPMPLQLIREIVKFRVNESTKKEGN